MMVGKTLTLTAVALAAVLGVRADEAGIMIDNFTFGPETVTVAAGTKVVWTNQDDIPHLVASAASPPLFRSAALDTGDTYATVFATPGTYRYFCGLHPSMVGTVVVR